MRTFTEDELNPFTKEPTFANVQEEMAWIQIMIDTWSRYPDQSMQLYAASMIHRLERLKKGEK